MKKYSEYYLGDYKKLNEFLVGFEFEFYSKVSYYKLLEILNNELDPIKVHGFKRYHSSFRPDSNNFKLEPDLSGGTNMAELVTGPMPYKEARYYLLKILNLIEKWGWTSDKSSLHINLSFNPETSEKTLQRLDILKHIAKTNESEIYNIFPDRENNIYAKSILNIIPINEYDYSNISIDIVRNTIKVPDDKYFGINFLNIFKNDNERRIEYRYIGGNDYHKKTGDILYFLDKWSLDIYSNLTEDFSNEEIDKISDFLDDKISNFKLFNKYDTFLVEFPNIHIQVDGQSYYDIVNAYYNKIYKKIYNFLEGVKDIEDECLINYYTINNKIEIVNCNFTSILNLENFDFINCEIQNGIFKKSQMINCKLNDIDIRGSYIENTDIIGSRIYGSKVENSLLDDCLFVAGYMNSEMIGGIFRSGKIGPMGSLSSTTKKVENEENFFGVKYSEIDKTDKDSKFKWEK